MLEVGEVPRAHLPAEPSKAPQLLFTAKADVAYGGEHLRTVVVNSMLQTMSAFDI